MNIVSQKTDGSFAWMGIVNFNADYTQCGKLDLAAGLVAKAKALVNNDALWSGAAYGGQVTYAFILGKNWETTCALALV